MTLRRGDCHDKKIDDWRMKNFFQARKRLVKTMIHAKAPLEILDKLRSCKWCGQHGLRFRLPSTSHILGTSNQSSKIHSSGIYCLKSLLLWGCRLMDVLTDWLGSTFALLEPSTEIEDKSDSERNLSSRPGCSDGCSPFCRLNLHANLIETWWNLLQLSSPASSRNI